MTTHRSFKRLVRARMDKTGESYTAARAILLAADAPKVSDGPSLSISDAVIREHTGRGWEEWFDLLDAWGAAERPNTEVRRWVAQVHGVESWGSQAVTINYQRARGLRAVGERPEGFVITMSKTVAVPVDRLYEAFVDSSMRARWLPEGDLRERTTLKPRSARFDWGDGASRVNVIFIPKGGGKSTVAVEHARLRDAEQAERMKAFWRDRVDALQVELER